MTGRTATGTPWSLYATVTDAPYLPRAWALYTSLARRAPSALFVFYCIDDRAADALDALHPANALVVRPHEFITGDLARVRADRATNEFCWTCKPAMLLHALTAVPAVRWAVYLDSDMLAFADPDPALRAAGDADVLLTPHRSTQPRFAEWEPVVGRFNAGYAAFRNSEGGVAALHWWLERCIELCPARPTRGVFADQTYLDELSGRFPAVAQSAEKGLNAGPWNIIGPDVTGSDAGVLVDSDPLMLYHFQGLRILHARIHDAYADHVQIPRPVLRHVYRPYSLAVADSIAAVRRVVDLPRAALWRQPRQVLHQVKRAFGGTSNLVFV